MERILIGFAAALGLALLANPQPARAGECADEVRALWDEGGAMDPFARPPHRTTNTVHDADGTVLRVYDSVIETPLRTISGVRGTHMTMAIDNDAWNGPDVDGPWTAIQGLPGDRRAGLEADRIQRRANLSDVQCPGLVARDAETYLAYGYTTRNDPDEAMGGFWYGSTDMVYLDPESRLPMIIEMTDFVTSFAPEPNPERHVVVFDYDPSIKVNPPE